MDSYKFSSQKQEQIYRRLTSLVGSGAAAFYRDACRLMEMEPPLESTTHYVAHSLREIESALRDVLEPIANPTVSNPNLSKCPSCGHKFSQPNQAPSHKDEINAILQALSIPSTDEVAQTWLKLAGRQNEYGLHGRAHRKDLAPPRPLDDKFRQFWNDIQAVFDVILDRFETQYSKVYCLLDELLHKSQPIKDDLKNLRTKIPNSFVALSYFFNQLLSAAWLVPLEKEGFFKNPPEPKITSNGGQMRVIPWPQSRYLLRMATQEPAKVLDIALEILETGTKNILLHKDLAEAALVMPSDLAARWVEKEIEWLRKQEYVEGYLVNQFIDLINYLTQENQINTALDLLQELLVIVPNSQGSGLGLEPQARFDEYYYGQILQNNLPKLLEIAGESTFKVLCNLLNNAISLLPSQNYSHNRRAAIEDEPHQATECLVSAVRDAVEQLAANNLASVRNLVTTLESYNWTIFQRLALHLLRRFPQDVPDLIAAQLMNRDRFQTEGKLYEYALLLREQFSNLSSEAQQTIFSWIEQGPCDLSWIDEDKITAYTHHWQRDWLEIINSNLPTEWQHYYEQLVQEIGPAKPLEPVSGFKVWVGPQSPKSAEELSLMNIAELFAYLRDWQPSGELFAPSRSGLGWELFNVVAQKPEVFVQEIEQFKKLDLEYGHWLLLGLGQVVSSRQQQTFSWSQVIKFCSWFLAQQQQTLKEQNTDSRFAQEWDQACEAIVDLVRAGLSATEENRIPLEFRRWVWKTIELITEDSSVIPGFETHYRYSNGRPAEVSVNTVRGKAMHAVMEYALWVKKYLHSEDKAENRVPSSFSDIPEVQKVLEGHLDPAQDPSLAIRSVYGKWFPALLRLDSGWTTQNLNRIFPRDKVLQELRSAAWEGYVTSHRADANLFPILRQEYSEAVEQLSTDPESSSWEFHQALAEHLLRMFSIELIELGESDRLVERFFEKAPAQLREYFTRRVGWLCREQVPPALLERLQCLWEWRISVISSVLDKTPYISELKIFGEWFASEKCDSKWAITQLITVLTLAKGINDNENLFSHLADIASSMPKEALQCLCLIADGINSCWLISFRQTSSYIILSSAIQSGDEKTRKAAEELINRLLARGIADFRDLLPNG